MFKTIYAQAYNTSIIKNINDLVPHKNSCHKNAVLSLWQKLQLRISFKMITVSVRNLIDNRSHEICSSVTEYEISWVFYKTIKCREKFTNVFWSQVAIRTSCCKVSAMKLINMKLFTVLVLRLWVCNESNEFIWICLKHLNETESNEVVF